MDSSLWSMMWPPVRPERAKSRRSSASRALRWAKDSCGMWRCTNSMAAASSRSPVGTPFASQTTSEAWSNSNRPWIPASSRARLFASAECPSNNRMNAGWSPKTPSSTLRCSGTVPKAFGFSPHPRNQPSSCVASARRSVRTSFSDVAAARSTPIVRSKPNTGWTWQSTNPGVSVAAPRSTRRVSTCCQSLASWRLPTATINPPLTATAWRGWSWCCSSMV